MRDWEGFFKEVTFQWAFIYFSSIGWGFTGSLGTLQVLSLVPIKGLLSPMESTESYSQSDSDVTHLLMIMSLSRQGETLDSRKKHHLRNPEPPDHCCMTRSPLWGSYSSPIMWREIWWPLSDLPPVRFWHPEACWRSICLMGRSGKEKRRWC